MNKNNFSSDFLNKYKENGFGNLLKSDIDLTVLKFILKYKIYSDIIGPLPDKIINFNHSHIFLLSKELRITQKKLKSLLERLSLIENETIYDEEFQSELKELIKKNTDINKVKTEGVIKFYVPNISFKNELEKRIADIGFIADYSFNKEIITVDIHSVFVLLSEDKDFNSIEFFKKLINENKELYKVFKSEIDEFSKKSTKEIFKSIAVKFGEKFLGDASKEFSDFIFSVVESFVKK